LTSLSHGARLVERGGESSRAVSQGACLPPHAGLLGTRFGTSGMLEFLGVSSPCGISFIKLNERQPFGGLSRQKPSVLSCREGRLCCIGFMPKPCFCKPFFINNQGKLLPPFEKKIVSNFGMSLLGRDCLELLL
jgi:hypothetical protein